MRVTITTINKAIKQGCTVLKSVYPKFKKPDITKISVGKSRSSWATITYHKNAGVFALRVSNCFEEIQSEQVAVNCLEDTIIHELIHTIPGCMNHGKNFKTIANKVNYYYPQYHISRCCDMQQFGIAEPAIKVKVTCQHCGHLWNYHKMPRWVGYKDRCICPYCKVKGQFDLCKV